MLRTLKIGTRGSTLALWQANMVRERLMDLSVYEAIDLVVIKTEADQKQEKPIADFGGKQVFVKELQEALLENKIDMAVHCLKDMAALSPKELICAAYLGDADRRDVLITRERVGLEALSPQAKIATGSPRRVAQLRLLGPEWEFCSLRGNVDTRLRKLYEGSCDAMILAAAGLERLSLTHHITHFFSPLEIVPCGGQGILALEMRQEDYDDRRIIGRLSQKAAEEAARIEFGVLRILGAGCRTPLGIYAERTEAEQKVTAFLAQEQANVSAHLKLTMHYAPGLDPEKIAGDFAARLKNDWQYKTGQKFVF